MNSRTALLSFALLFGAMFAFSSCKKDKKDDPQADTDPIVLNCDYFTSARTLTDDPNRPVDYRINCLMEANAAVVVQPGVVIEFGPDAGIHINGTGSLNAVGTSSSPISLSGATKSAGSWRGLLFESNATLNKLQYVNLSHAGGAAFNSNGDIASVVIWADARLELDHVQISQSGNHGISAIYNNTSWSISNSTVTTSANAPVIFHVTNLDAFDGSNDFTGNTRDHLLMDLSTHSITTNTVWKKSSVPYQVTSSYSFYDHVNVSGANLTIEPGVTIQFEEATGLWIDDGASLVAEGTPTEKITFKGAAAGAGYWTAIYFDYPGTTTNLIRHAEITGAGATVDGRKTGILMRVSPTLTLDQVDFKDIDGCSIYHMDVVQNPNLTTTNLTHTNTNGTLCND